MADERRREGGERDEGGRAPRGAGLLDLLRRIVAPRPAEILVMEPDGRLVCVRCASPGDKATR